MRGFRLGMGFSLNANFKKSFAQCFALLVLFLKMVTEKVLIPLGRPLGRRPGAFKERVLFFLFFLNVEKNTLEIILCAFFSYFFRTFLKS